MLPTTFIKEKIQELDIHFVLLGLQTTEQE